MSNGNLLELPTFDEYKIGDNLYTKMITYTGVATDWTLVSGVPADSRSIRIDYGKSYILVGSLIIPFGGTYDFQCQLGAYNKEVKVYSPAGQNAKYIIRIVYDK